jgi:hypothetical protein
MAISSAAHRWHDVVLAVVFSRVMGFYCQMMSTLMLMGATPISYFQFCVELKVSNMGEDVVGKI